MNAPNTSSPTSKTTSSTDQNRAAAPGGPGPIANDPPKAKAGVVSIGAGPVLPSAWPGFGLFHCSGCGGQVLFPTCDIPRRPDGTPIYKTDRMGPKSRQLFEECLDRMDATSGLTEAINILSFLSQVTFRLSEEPSSRAMIDDIQGMSSVLDLVVTQLKNCNPLAPAILSADKNEASS